MKMRFRVKALHFLSALAILGGLAGAEAEESKIVDSVCALTQAAPVRCPEWMRRHDLGGTEEGMAVEVSPLGDRVYMGVHGWFEGYEIGSVVSYAAETGAFVWSHPTGDFAVYDVAASADDSRVFAVSRASDYSSHKLWALDPDGGEVLWIATMSNAAAVVPTVPKLIHVEVSQDSKVAFVARTTQGVDDFDLDFVVEAYDAGTGRRLWASRYDNGRDVLTSFAIDPLGSMVFAGGLSGTQQDYATVAFRANDGEQVWASTYDVGINFMRGLAVSPDGTKVAVTGESWASGHPAMATVLMNAHDGSTLWARRFDGLAMFGTERGHAVTFARASRVVATGESDSRYATVSYDVLTGEQQWVALAQGEHIGGMARAIATSGDARRIYVTGFLNSFADTRAYNAEDGIQLWLGREIIDGGYSQGIAVGPGPQGAVFVTGGIEPDAGTLAYRY